LKSTPANVINHKNIPLLFEAGVIQRVKRDNVLIYAVQLNSHKAWSTTTKGDVSDMASYIEYEIVIDNEHTCGSLSIA
jgi:hypothetical protein